MKQLIMIIIILVSVEINAKEQDIPVMPSLENTVPKKKNIPKTPEVTLRDNLLYVSGIESLDPLTVKILADDNCTLYEVSSCQSPIILPVLKDNEEYILNLYIESVWWTATFVY